MHTYTHMHRHPISHPLPTSLALDSAPAARCSLGWPSSSPHPTHPQPQPAFTSFRSPCCRPVTPEIEIDLPPLKSLVSAGWLRVCALLGIEYHSSLPYQSIGRAVASSRALQVRAVRLLSCIPGWQVCLCLCVCVCVCPYLCLCLCVLAWVCGSLLPYCHVSATTGPWLVQHIILVVQTIKFLRPILEDLRFYLKETFQKSVLHSLRH